MAAPLATPTDLEDSMGRALTSAELPKAESALRYASNLVRAMAPWVDSLATLPDAVVDAVVSLAERRFYAPRDGATNRTVGNVSVAYNRADSTATFTQDERLLLVGALRLSGNMTVSLAGPDLLP